MSSAVRRNKVNVSDVLIFILRHLMLYSPVVWLVTLPAALVWSQSAGQLAGAGINVFDNYLQASGRACPHCSRYFDVFTVLTRLSVFVPVSAVMIAIADRRRSASLGAFLLKCATGVVVFAALALYFAALAFAAYVALNEVSGFALIVVAFVAAPLAGKVFQFLLAAPIVVFEGSGLFDALDRSSWLMHRNYVFAIAWLALAAAGCVALLHGAHGLIEGLPGALPVLRGGWRAGVATLHLPGSEGLWPSVAAALPDLIRVSADLWVGLVWMSVLLALYWAFKRFDDRALWAKAPDGVDPDWRTRAVETLKRQGVREHGVALNLNRRWRYVFSILQIGAVAGAVSAPALLWLAYDRLLPAARRDALAAGTPEPLRSGLQQPATLLPWFMTVGDALVLAAFGLAALALYAALQANGRARRRLAMEARGVRPTIEIARAHGPPVFYLRSFNFDRQATRPSPWSQLLSLGLALVGVNRITLTPEMALVLAIPRRVPVVAIGRPGERAPPPGVLRFYATDEIWKDEVEAIVPACQMVIWVTGYTEGLKWEVQHLLTHSRPERLVLWNHASVGRPAEREREWAQFLATYADLFPKGLPADGARAAFIAFDADWTPIAAPSRAFPLTLADRMRLGNAPIFGFRSIVRRRLVG